MKKYFLFALLIFSFAAKAQNRSNIWELSVSEDDGNVYTYLPALNFEQGFADTFSVYRNMSMYITDAGICDTQGNLLFYSNGRFIANRNNDTLQNCNEFNKGYGTDKYYGDDGLGILQGMMILPHPDSSSLYDLIYETFVPIKYNKFQYYFPVHLSHSVVDMRKDKGLGAITTKNEYLIEDTLLQGKLSACKAANGRDWWIIAHKWNSPIFYTWLLTPSGIEGPYTQSIGSKFLNGFVYGQACFSPDGNQLIIESSFDFTMDYYHFDRCTGSLSDWQTVKLKNPKTDGDFLGGAFSTDGRYFYADYLTSITQFDTKQNNFFQHPDTVALWDSSVFDDNTSFTIMQHASDNRIYISTKDGTNTLTYIDKPDSGGLLCNVIQHGVILPYVNCVSVPYFPNYDLGPLGNYLADAGTNDTIVKGQSVQLGIPPVAGVKYEWKSNPTLSDTTVAQPIATPDTTTTYYVAFTDTSTFSSCNVREDTVTVFVKIATSNQSQKPQAKSQNSFTVFPNPVSKWLNIVYHSNDDALFELYNQFGQEVATVSLYHYFKNRMMDVNSLASGIYEYRIIQRNQTIQSGSVGIVR